MQSAGTAQGVKFKPFGPIQSAYAPQLAPAAQSQSMPAPGPSPGHKTGKWKPKPLPANRAKGRQAAGVNARAHLIAQRRAAGGAPRDCALCRSDGSGE